MRVLGGPCPNQNCPKVIDPQDGSGELIVQGLVTDLEVPAGETAGRIPMAYLAEAVDRLRAEGRL